MVAAATIPTGATAAQLVGGREQTAVLKAFARSPGARNEVATSVRASTAARSWVVVRWVSPATGFKLRPPAPTLHSSFFQVGHRVTAGSPPAAARRDLQAPFSVAVLYTGHGSEAVRYQQSTPSICVGNGIYVDTEQEMVTPMSWTVRYVVNLDRLQAAVASGRTAAVLPTIAFDRSRSQLSAAEQSSRTSVDQGCFGPTRTIRCARSYFLQVPGAASQVGLGPAGLQIGSPMATRQRGDCTADGYPLGPSLWDGGAATVSVGALSLTGGRLPAHPYAPVTVAWPFSAAGAQQGYLASPCQGIPAECTDTMHWTGSVRLQALGG
ncbi:MAG: hypothetical protein NVS3B18_11110 [Candidatus Dormibacteria bacterium]